MRREIKFQGYNTAFQKWVVGDLVQCRDEVFIWDDDGQWEVDPDTVDQLIACDVNGAEIFEGDEIVCVKFWDAYLQKYMTSLVTEPREATFFDYGAILRGEFVKWNNEQEK